MHCIIVGSDHTAALEHYYKRHLLKEGVQADIFPIQQHFLAHYHKSLFNKILVRVGLSGIYRQINQQLYKTIEQANPGWVWVFKGMEVLPSTIQRLKDRNIRVVNFNPDNPFIFSGTGSGNSNVTRSIMLFDHYFSYDSDTVQQLQNKKIPASLLPFGHDVEDDLYNEVAHTTTEKVKTCFLGMPDKYRAAFITELAAAGIEIDCYGEGWASWVNHTNVQCFGARYGKDFWSTLYQYRVQLNYMRPHNLRSHNMRTFEIPAIGGIQVAPRTKDHAAFFKDGEEIFLYNTTDECVQVIRALLLKNAAESSSIRSNARKKCVEGGYSYACRTRQVLQVVKQLI